MIKEELTHKVYLATFGKPRYVMEIGELIYGAKRDTYPKLMGKDGAINKCVKKEWIEKVTIPVPKENPRGFDKRTYYLAKVDPIISDIKKHTSLNDFDEYVLRTWLESSDFRFLIDLMSIEESFDMAGFLTLLNLFAIFYLRNKKLIEMDFDKEITNKKRYDFWINSFKNKLKRPRIEAYKLFIEFIKKEYQNSYRFKLLEKEFTKEDFPIVPLFVTKSLMEKLKGISIIGSMGYFFDMFYDQLYNQKEELNRIFSKY